MMGEKDPFFNKYLLALIIICKLYRKSGLYRIPIKSNVMWY